MMELQHITAGYGGAPVVRDVTLRCPAGRVTALCGPNGCGKSTLIRVAARQLEPAGGRLLLAGRDAAALSRREFARQVAVFPQLRAVPALTAEALVLHGRFPHLGYPRRYGAKDRQIVAESLAAAGAAQLAQVPVEQLSGGQRQKVYFAMTLAQRTPVVLLDEPTTYLDIRCQLELMALVRALAAAGKAVLMVLHDLNLALQYADEVAVLSAGRLTAAGTPGAVVRAGALERAFGVHVHPVQPPEGGVQYVFTPRR